jgi:cation transport regulator ChaC
MKYFAYGSNLDQVQMAQRCPAAKLVGPAQLANHRICFPRRSPVRDCAVASIESHKGGIVWGVIYELDDDDLARLDAREGFDPVNSSAVNRYCRVDVTVQQTAGGRTEAVAYVAVPEEDPGQPSWEYLRHIIDGARAHSFPDDYVDSLLAIAAIENEVIVSFAAAAQRQEPQPADSDPQSQEQQPQAPQALEPQPADAAAESRE